MRKQQRALPKKDPQRNRKTAPGVQEPPGQNVHFHPCCADKVKVNMRDSLARLPAARQEALDAIEKVAKAMEAGDHVVGQELAMELTDLLFKMLRALTSMDSALLSLSTECMAALDKTPGASCMAALKEAADMKVDGKG